MDNESVSEDLCHSQSQPCLGGQCYHLETSRYGLLPRAMSEFMAWQRSGSNVVPMTPDATKGFVDAGG